MTEWRSRIVGHGEEAPDSLMANPRNWRKHPVAQQKALAGLLGQVGWVQDIIVNRRTGHVVDGHLRVELARGRSEASVPVVYVDLSPEEEALVLASLDPLAAMATADAEMLASLLADVQVDDDALAAMLAGLGMGPKPGLTDPDDVPEVVEPVTKPGDLWLLGEHRLLCGDATKAEDVARVMGGERADLCFTSPPYAQQRDYGAKINDWDGLMIGVFGGLPMNTAGQVLVNLGMVHEDGEWLPYWSGWIEWMRQQGWRRFGWYVWDQGFGLPGDWNGRLAPSHEFVFHFNKEIRRANKTTMRGQDGVVREFSSPSAGTNTHKIPDSVIRVLRHQGGLGSAGSHPAVFSVAFAVEVVDAFSDVADVEYEPFSGSGTTIIACEQLGRRCYGIEISPHYCDVAVKRWEQFTGKAAVRDGSD